MQLRHKTRDPQIINPPIMVHQNQVLQVIYPPIVCDLRRCNFFAPPPLGIPINTTHIQQPYPEPIIIVPRSVTLRDYTPGTLMMQEILIPRESYNGPRKNPSPTYVPTTIRAWGIALLECRRTLLQVPWIISALLI